MRRSRVIPAIIAVLLVALPAVLIGKFLGGPPGRTGAPGEQTCASLSCHDGRVNPGDGVIRTDGLFDRYVPGSVYDFEFELDQVDAATYGFQAAARPERFADTVKAGRWEVRQENTRVRCSDGSFRPPDGDCSTSISVIEFIEHSMPQESEDFKVRWIAPDTDIGPIRIYVAMLGADGDLMETGDQTYTHFVELTPAESVDPSISGISQAFDNQERASEGTFIQIFGENFFGPDRDWGPEDFDPAPEPGDPVAPGSQAPTNLDGIEVLVNGKNAFVSYAGHKQVNAVVAGETGVGPAAVQVKTNDGSLSNTMMLTIGSVSPALHEHPLWVEGEKKFAVALHLDFTEYANKEGLVENPDRPLRTPKPGDVVVMFLLGAGPTDPLVPPGTVPSGGEAIAGEAELRIGGMVVETQIVLSGFVGLYQAAFTVPDLPVGDYRMELSIDGISSGQELYFTIGE